MNQSTNDPRRGESTHAHAAAAPGTFQNTERDMGQAKQLHMDAPTGLRMLAEWFDQRDEKRGVFNDHVQRDLRKWADAYSALESSHAELLEAMEHIKDNALRACDGYGPIDEWVLDDDDMKIIDTALANAAKVKGGANG